VSTSRRAAEQALWLESARQSGYAGRAGSGARAGSARRRRSTGRNPLAREKSLQKTMATRTTGDILITQLAITLGVYSLIAIICAGIYRCIPKNTDISLCCKLSAHAWYRWCCFSQLGWCVSGLYMEQEMRKFKTLNELLIQRLDGLESNQLTSESVKLIDQRVDRLQEQIKSLEQSFRSLETRGHTSSIYSCQTMLEPQETVSHTACPIEFPNLHRDS
jgi:hypothetical protein